MFFSYTTFLASPIANITALENSTISYLTDRNVQFSYADWPASDNGFIFDYPEGFRGMLNWIINSFGNHKIVLTENGWSDNGTEGLNDTARITYIAVF